MEYPFAWHDNLDQPQTYRYSDYCGPEFLGAWQMHRAQIGAKLATESLDINELVARHLDSVLQSNYPMLTNVRLAELCDELGASHRFSPPIRAEVNGWVKTFEVRKRLFGAYNEHMKPIPGQEYRDADSYLLFALLMGRAWSSFGGFPYLNSLLKVMDSIASIADTLTPQERGFFISLLKMEKSIVTPLMNRVLSSAD